MSFFTKVNRIGSKQFKLKSFVRYRGNISPSFVELETPNKKITLTAGDLFFRSIKRNNVKHAFIYSGGAIMPWVDKFYKSDIDYFVNTHEQNSGHSLTGYSKSLFNHDKKAIVLTTSGPGFTNLVTPMLDMKNDSTPGVFITGQVPLNAVGSNAFQEAPSVDISKHVTKYSTQIKSILDIEYKIDKAFEIAYSGKMGPVHLDIPKCVATEEINEAEYKLLKNEDNSIDFSRIQNSNPITITKSMEIVYGLRNFIGNANKFANSKIFINVKSDSNFTEVIIEDDGQGYPKDVLNKIGEPYIKSINSSTKSKSGLGLGIFIGKTLLEKNYANILCRNSKTRSGAEVCIKWKNESLINI